MFGQAWGLLCRASASQQPSLFNHSALKTADPLQVASWLGEEQLKQQMEGADPLAAEQLQLLRAGLPLGGGGGGSENGGGAMIRPRSG